LVFKIGTGPSLREKRKEAEGIFINLRTTVDHEPNVYKISKKTQFSKLPEFRLQQRCK
jgi:hypothetical protein